MLESSGRSWKEQEVGKVNLPTSLSYLNGNVPTSDFSFFQTAFSNYRYLVSIIEIDIAHKHR